MDIKSKLPYPAGDLSNFAPYEFEFDGVLCSSMEGLLQSLKEPDSTIQTELCKLIGMEAKNSGLDRNWQDSQTLWWQGRAYDRHSKEYQDLLDRAYAALFKNELFRKALAATGQEVLTHSIGNADPTQTILTEEEFCSRLIQLRKQLH